MATDIQTNTSSVAQAIDKANKGQSSQALIIQSYANSVNQQPMVDFSGEDKLKKFETDINDGLKTAQSHANQYLNVIQPAILENISNIGNYYALDQAVATTLPKGSTEKQWIAALSALATESGKYQTAALGVVSQLQTLSKNLSTDSADFKTVVTKLNAAVDGDNGILDSISDQLDTIQSHIDGAIAGTALGGLAILGGVFLIAVGAVTDFITVGASTPMVVGGVVVLLTNKEPFDKIKAAVKSSTLSINSNQVLSITRNIVTTMNGYFNQLSLIQSDTTSQKTRLEAQLLGTQSQEEAPEKQNYWLIALGPFGLIGLAAALAAYLAIKSQVDGYKNQITPLNSQISSLDSMSAATGDMSTDIGDVVSKVSSVNNAVTFVTNDVLNVETDLNSSDAPSVVKIMVETAITEVKTLKKDAS